MIRRLTLAEQLLVESAARGELCDIASAFQTSWARSIRSWVLRDLCLQRHGWSVDPKGVQVKGAIFTGEINLQYCDLPFGLTFISCEFKNKINLTCAKMKQILMPACVVLEQLEANYLELTGSIAFCDLRTYRRWWLGEEVSYDEDNRSFKAHKPVYLLGAKIGGHLVCHGGHFLDATELCLYAQGIEVGQYVLLKNDFLAKGTVLFRSARVGGNFACEGGQFLAEGEQCLVAQGMKVGQNVFFTDGFVTNGNIDLTGCQIKGGLYIEECRIVGATILAQASVGGCLKFSPDEIGCIDLRDAHVREWDDQWVVSSETPKIHWSQHCLWEWGYKKWLQQSENEQNLQSRMTQNPVCFSRMRKYRFSGFTYDYLSDHLSAAAQSNPKAIGLWFALSDNDKYDPQPYEQMAKVLKSHGQEDAYREVIIAKRVERRRRKNMHPFFSFLDFCLLDVPVRYGYKPWRAILVGIIIWFFMSLLFCYFANSMVPADSSVLLAAIAAKERKIQQAPLDQRKTIRRQPLCMFVPQEYPKFMPFLYTMDLFVPIIDLHHEYYWEIDRSRPEAPLLLFTQWVVVLSGWYLTTLFISSFTGLLRVD